MAQLSCGIVGLPNVGKSTLFNALTSCIAEASNYPFCTIEPNMGIVEVYDPRLEVLSKMSKSQKLLYATTKFLDIAGLVEGASKGEGLGNKFLSNIRETSAIVHVVRCFVDDDVTHVSGGIDPIRDIEVINTELLLSDLQMIESALERIEKQMKSQKEAPKVKALLERVVAHLNEGNHIRSLELSEEEEELLKPYPLITRKKVLYVANVGEDSLPSLENEYVQRVREYAEKEGSYVLPICAKLEAEIAELDEEERKEYLQSLGLEMSGLQRLIKTSFDMLGLITFLTTGEMETRAWTIHKGESAVSAAGQIHTDIQKGFIRAEVVAYEDIVEAGSRAASKEMGKLRTEGRDYIVRDGDVVLFLHN